MRPGASPTITFRKDEVGLLIVVFGKQQRRNPEHQLVNYFTQRSTVERRLERKRNDPGKYINLVRRHWAAFQLYGRVKNQLYHFIINTKIVLIDDLREQILK